MENKKFEKYVANPKNIRTFLKKHLRLKGYWRCAAGWGRIDYNGVTFLVELLE